ncbi:MAG: C40 family peptidase [Chitinophagaceae bacterium]|nr:C40 family peptidase [Chitinophagaceae bacterium]
MMLYSCSTQKKTSSIKPPASSKEKREAAINDTISKHKGATEATLLISYQEEYANLLGTPEEINNLALFQFMDEWMTVPYKYGGNSKSGVDCSRLSILLMKEVYHKVISGSSADIIKQTEPVSKDHLKEGDLVFFKINSATVSHMGVYLANDRFLHSTTQAGVVISDLNDAYYKKYFFAGGSVR